MFKAKLTPSYRFDELNLVLEVSNDEDLIMVLNSLGYEIREPEPTDELRTAKGYSKGNAKMIKLAEPNDFDNGWYTLQTRPEFDKFKNKIPDSGFIALSGPDMDNIGIVNLLKTLDGYSHATRLDIAVDLRSSINSESSVDCKKPFFETLPGKMQLELSKLFGFTVNLGKGNQQSKKNAITHGLKNTKKPIKKASKTASNGLTLYLGGRQSKFFMRFYNKSAEVKQRVNKIIPPTLRAEVEAKQEVAEAVRKYIVGHSKSTVPTLARKMFQTVSNDYVTLNNKNMNEVLGIKNVKTSQLDYVKIEGEQMEFSDWVSESVAPKFGKMFGHLSKEKQIQKAIELLNIKDN